MDSLQEACSDQLFHQCCRLFPTACAVSPTWRRGAGAPAGSYRGPRPVGIILTVDLPHCGSLWEHFFPSKEVPHTLETSVLIIQLAVPVTTTWVYGVSIK